jgi:adenine-specific DNA-methyltransferase
MGSNVLDKELQKATGAHYTPLHLSDFVAQKMVEAWAEGKNHSSSIKILDPAIGDGELMLALLKELQLKGLSPQITAGFDIDRDAVRISSERIMRDFPKVDTLFKEQDFLKLVLDMYESPGAMPLFNSGERYDLVITNPPYVRTQHLGQAEAQKLAKNFGMRGRVDLYQAFIMALSRVLAPGGVTGIIASNRFMSTRAGQGLREFIVEHFDILHLWDLGDTKIFNAAVLPAVLLLRRKNEITHTAKIPFTTIYSSTVTESAAEFISPLDALEAEGPVSILGNNYEVKHGELITKNGDVWAVHTEDSSTWLKKVNANTRHTFSDIGNIRVGVKTTADKVFIKQQWDSMEESKKPEALKPLITHHIASRYHARSPEKKILYPYKSENGKRVAVDFKQNPKTLSFLQEHEEVLRSRSYVQESGREWWAVWVPHHPKYWDMPKIVFRDISQRPEFWLDNSGAVVNGDCYWIACEELEKMDLFWLALAVGNSRFIEKFYDTRFNNKLYAGRRRFITQYVNEFPLPDPEHEVSLKLVELVKEIHSQKQNGYNTENLEAGIDALVDEAFGVN